jgi:lipid II:glycine glycyltransferase (peptidoglycan interpeptide bridge formation enzyme)
LTAQGVKNWQLSVYHNHQVVGQCLLYSRKLFFGKSYLYAPKGPFINVPDPDQAKEVFALMLTQIRDITIGTQERQEIFCRLEPNIIPPKLDIPCVQTESIQPDLTTVLNLQQSEETLFASFKEKTRYNIRLAEKKELTVSWDNGSVGLEKFLSLLPKTSLRHRIRSHQRKHYESLIQADDNEGIVQIAWAHRGKQVVAAHLYIFYGSTVTYLHGASDYNERALMAPYLVQWEAIKRAQSLGFRYFDFGGLAPADGSKPSWEGFSRFKRSFNGEELKSPGTYDFIYVPMWYTIYLKLRQFNRFLLSLKKRLHL